ncbi:MAG TPA: MFS transporter [Steroidobacteraceae bacterium]|nr:MFS transporter [Steroidobacteraceae bacterium]
MLHGEHASLWAAAASIWLMFAGSTLLTPLYQLYRQAFGFSQLVLTLIYSAYVLGNLFSLLLLGRLSDQLGRRAVTLAGIAIAAVATAVFLIAFSTPWLFAGRIVSGVGIALGAMGLLVARLPETAKHRVGSAQQLSLEPRIGVLRELLGRFIAPAAICFSTFAVFGYYAAVALLPLAEGLHSLALLLVGSSDRRRGLAAHHHHRAHRGYRVRCGHHRVVAACARRRGAVAAETESLKPGIRNRRPRRCGDPACGRHDARCGTH